jgi:uncharacterized membrane protein YoaK (UPF0700 family)
MHTLQQVREIAMADCQVPLTPLKRALTLTMALSFMAGIVDVVGFVALFGLFTSHFTGNFVVIGQEIVDHSLRLIAELIAIPMFVLIAALTRLLVLQRESRGASALRACLLFQIAMLIGCLGVGVAASPITDPAAIGSIVAAQFGVAAMAIQNATCRLVFPEHPPTTVMTINLTQASIDLVDMNRSVPGLSDTARRRFERTAPVIGAFAAGVVFGAYGYLYASFWCLAIPILGLAAIALLFHPAART